MYKSQFKVCVWRQGLIISTASLVMFGLTDLVHCVGDLVDLGHHPGHGGHHVGHPGAQGLHHLLLHVVIEVIHHLATLRQGLVDKNLDELYEGYASVSFGKFILVI